MIKDTSTKELLELERFVSVEEPSSQVKINRRAFVQMLGAGLLITVTEGLSFGQRRSRGGAVNTVGSTTTIGFTRCFPIDLRKAAV